MIEIRTHGTPVSHVKAVVIYMEPKTSLPIVTITLSDPDVHIVMDDVAVTIRQDKMDAARPRVLPDDAGPDDELLQDSHTHPDLMPALARAVRLNTNPCHGMPPEPRTINAKPPSPDEIVRIVSESHQRERSCIRNRIKPSTCDTTGHTPMDGITFGE